MNEDEILQELISIVKSDSSKAIGCTEPVAIAYCSNLTVQNVNRKQINRIDVRLSKNIYKNAKSVKIPGTGRSGIDLAVALGVSIDSVTNPMLVFRGVNDSVINAADSLINSEVITIEVLDNREDVYIEVEIEADKTAKTVISGGHTNVSKIVVDDEIIKDKSEEKLLFDRIFDIKSLSFEQLKTIVDNADFDKISFTLEGIDVNMQAASEGLKGYGMSLGKSLRQMYEQSKTDNDILNKTRYLAAAAADMRMGGGQYPVMTSGGSGNQGIGIILPIYIVAQENKVDDELLAKSLFFAHCLNRYVKEYSGKLSGMCGCGIASSIGSTAGIVYMLGGNSEKIAGACSNIYANLTGMICDGAKESCSLKLSTSAVESIINAYLSLNGVVVEGNVGVIGDSIENTINNIGRLSRESFVKVDETVIDII
ncbi:L-cysteine desulfidase family protein [Anaerococcus provencensis]|uniref:L-cysteine desulfidase family protein n=1 Tax=Anaerococcus provencensis TaxID=938293 RepID=UPI00030F9BF7|nr:L-serine ammonia-lyase, iron-sulfur-dependent, subunit alpha [Anaerococcus provencensis]